MTAKAEEKAKAKEEKSRKETARLRALLWLWSGVLIAPLAFLSNLQANYTLTQKLCPGGRTLPLHLTTIGFLLLTMVGGFIAWRNWGQAGREWPDESADNRERNRFMSAVGLLISGLSFLIIVAQWIPQFIFNPCQR